MALQRATPDNLQCAQNGFTRSDRLNRIGEGLVYDKSQLSIRKTRRFFQETRLGREWACIASLYGFACSE
jgi:hypothetical protein